MTDGRPYPDGIAGSFPTPPDTMIDAAGRTIMIRAAGDAPHHDDAGERDAVIRMYAAFDPADRAQGVPPVTDGAIQQWVDDVFGSDSVNVLAWHGDVVVGHGMLVPDADGTFELAIFVLQAFQGAGIGRAVIERVLGAGRARGVDRVWLTVERWNAPAIRLYRQVGFEPSKTRSFELEMSLLLGARDDATVGTA